MQSTENSLSKNNFLKDDMTSKLYRSTNLANAVHQVSKNVLDNFYLQKENIETINNSIFDIYKRLNIQANQVVFASHSFAKSRTIEYKNLFLKELLFLMSLINIANKNYNMSDMNSELLVKGCNYLRDIAESLDLVDSLIKDSSIDADIHKEIDSIKDTHRDIELGKNIQTQISTQKDNFSKLEKPIFRNLSKSIPDARKNGRREQVLALLSKTPISIKEISDKIVGCSEKTIQRELNTLLDMKKILRVGEKRWSRYTLSV